MAVSVQELEIRLRANISDLKKGINTSKGDFKQMSASVQASITDMSNLMKLKVGKEMAASFEQPMKQARELKRLLDSIHATKQPTSVQMETGRTGVTQYINNLNAAYKEQQLRAATQQVSGMSKEQQAAIVTQARFNDNLKVQAMALKDLERAANKELQAEKALHSEWITGRYALYDLSSSMQQVSRGLLQFTGSVYQAQFAQQQAFSQVERVQVGTDPAKLKALKEQLIDLTKEIPLAFNEISKIAMLGSQLGIATESLGKFTDTVAKFSTITGVSVETAATTFGKLSNLLKLSADQYDNLGSSIAYVGVNAAATETDILSSSRQISAVATAAGFTADQVIGLASAMSSLGTAPEEARGVLVPTFNAMDNAVRSFSATTGTGNDALTVFATTAGMTAQQFVDAWSDKKSGGAAKAFNAFVAGLGKGNTSKILNQLALDGVRTSKGLTALGQNAEIVFQQMDDAALGMKMGDYLDQSFAKTVDDIAAKLQLLGAAVQEMFAAMAGSEVILGALGVGLDALKNILSMISDSMKGPVTSTVAGVVLALTGLLGIIMGVAAAAALSLASIYALRVALNQLGKDEAIAATGAYQLIKSLVGVEGQAFRTSAAVRGIGIALKSSLILLVASMAVEGIFNAVTNSAETAANKTKSFFGDLSGLKDAMMIDTANVANGQKAIATFAVETQKMTDEEKKAAATAKNLASVLGDVGNAADASSTKTEQSSLAFGKASQEYLHALLRQNDSFNQIVSSDAFANYFTEIGANIDDLIALGAQQGGSEKIDAYFADLTAKAIQKAKDTAAQAGQIGFTMPTGTQSIGAGWGFDPSVQDNINKLKDGLGGIADVGKEAANTQKILGKTAQETAANEAELTSELEKQVKATFATINAQAAVDESLQNLAKSLDKNKKDFSTTTDSGRANIKALEDTIAAMVANSGGDFQKAANDLAGLKLGMMNAGVGGAVAFGLIDAAIAETGKNITNFSAIDFSKLFGSITVSAGTAKTALERLQEQITKTFRSLDANLAVQDSVKALGDSLAQAGMNFGQFSEAGRQNVSNLRAVIDDLAVKSNGNLKVLATNLASLRKALADAGAPASALKIIDTEIKKLGVSAKASTSLVKQFAAALNSVGDASLLAAADAAQALESRLNSLFSATISGQMATLSLAAGYEAMQKRIAEANAEIKKIKAEIEGLVADKGVLEYQLQIAIKYGDTLRANEIQAKISQINADIAGKRSDISNLQQQIVPTTAEAQLALLTEVEGQANKIQAVFSKMLVSGQKTKAEMYAWVDQQTQMFYDQAVAAGMSEEQAMLLAGTLKKDLYDAIKKTPAIVLNTKAAHAAVKSLQAAIDSIKGKTVYVTVKTIYETETKLATGGLVTGPGTGTSDSIPAKLSNGEFVMNAQAVKTYGVDFMNSLNQMRPIQTMPASSAVQSSATSSGMVYLSPEDRQLLRAAIDRPVNLYTDNTKIASSANAGNVILAQRGTN